MSITLKAKFSGDAERNIREMADQLGLNVNSNEDMNELILDALSVYDFAVEERSKGNKVGSFPDGGGGATTITTELLDRLDK